MEPIFLKIYDQNIASLHNLDKNFDESILITFSGAPGSGKSTISRELESKFGFVRIVNDDIRNIIVGLQENAQVSLVGLFPGTPDRDRIRFLQQHYLLWLLDRLSETPNKRLVLDLDMDFGFYLKVKQWSNSNSYELHCAALVVSKQELQERITKRAASQIQRSLDRLDFYLDRQSNFIKQVGQVKQYVSDSLDVGRTAESIMALLS